MKLVKPCINKNYIIKTNSVIEKMNLISEIGIFGVLIGLVINYYLYLLNLNI